MKKRPAIFLDRDGTIIRQVELLHKPSELRLLPHAAEAIRAMNRMGYVVVIVTNQPVVSRGIITPADVDHIHEVLLGRLMKKGARIDAVYFCPHHPHSTMPEYGIVCECRKPAHGMVLRAAKEHNLDLKKSFHIGDSTKDVQAGNREKVKMILVQTGHKGNDVWQHEGKPDFVVKNLVAAARLIKKLSK